MRNSGKTRTGAKERKPVSHPGLIAVFGLLAVLFFFTSAYGMIDHGFGFHLRQGRWTVAGIVWLAMTLGVASILTVGFLALMPAAMSRLLALVLALLVWCAIVLVVLLFAFRSPANFYVEYTSQSIAEIESHAPTHGALEETAVGFSYRPLRIAKGWWNTKRTYTLTQAGSYEDCHGLGDHGKCHVMECLSEKWQWFAGAWYRHYWHVRSQMSPEDLANVSCHEVDPSALKSDHYDDMGRRVEYGAAS